MADRTLLNSDMDTHSPREVAGVTYRAVRVQARACPLAVGLLILSWLWFLGPTSNLAKLRLAPGLPPLFEGAFAVTGLADLPQSLKSLGSVAKRRGPGARATTQCEAIQTCVEVQLHTGRCRFVTAAPLYVKAAKGAQRCKLGPLAAGTAVISTKFEDPILILSEDEGSPNDCRSQLEDLRATGDQCGAVPEPALHFRDNASLAEEVCTPIDVFPAATVGNIAAMCEWAWPLALMEPCHYMATTLDERFALLQFTTCSKGSDPPLFLWASRSKDFIADTPDTAWWRWLEPLFKRRGAKETSGGTLVGQAAFGRKLSADSTSTSWNDLLNSGSCVAFVSGGNICVLPLPKAYHVLSPGSQLPCANLLGSQPSSTKVCHHPTVFSVNTIGQERDCCKDAIAAGADPSATTSAAVTATTTETTTTMKPLKERCKECLKNPTWPCDWAVQATTGRSHQRNSRSCWMECRAQRIHLWDHRKLGDRTRKLSNDSVTHLASESSCRSPHL